MRVSLWFDGFRAVSDATDTYLRPAWPKQRAISRARLYPGTCTYGCLLTPLCESKLQAMYCLDELDREAKALARWVGRRKVPGSNAHAFAELLDAGGRVARLIVHDPRLPPDLWNNRTGLRELIHSYDEFEKRMKPAAQCFIEESLSSGG